MESGNAPNNLIKPQFKLSLNRREEEAQEWPASHIAARINGAPDCVMTHLLMQVRLRGCAVSRFAADLG